MDLKKQNDRLAATSQTHCSRFPAAGAAETPRDGHSLQRNLGQAFLSRNLLMKSANRATRRDALGLRRRRCRGGLRTNWRHPCFQCNCTYLASHLRGSFRGSGLIESIGGAMRERERDGERERESSQADWIFGPLHPSLEKKKRKRTKKVKLPHRLARRLTRDTFNQSALIAAPLWLGDAGASFPFIEILSDHYFTGSSPTSPL